MSNYKPNLISWNKYPLKHFSLYLYKILKYSLFHKTLSRSSIQINWISVRFYEMGDIKILKVFFLYNQKFFFYQNIPFQAFLKHKNFLSCTCIKKTFTKWICHGIILLRGGGGEGEGVKA